ncbi:alpha/beta hydrolase family esterase [Actinomadura keratinilytica]|uniref:Polyhydroxybutyrate depolymerase n=1 Tax=Actinomadura keratinilytica TaxID=547461 RepID=A0ABP7YHT3_9ACTN
MLRQVAAPLLGMALTLTACSVNGSRGASSGRPPTSAGGTAAAAAPSAGCTRTPTAAGGRYRFGGRSYLLTLPRSRGRTPVPLVLDLHGLRSNGFQEAVYSRVASLGAARGFAVVEPNGATRPRGWRLPGMADGTADVRYIRGLLDHLESTLCVDTGREFATGFSNGAGMSAALVCGLGGRLAAVAPVAGLNLTRPCADPRPTTMLVFHGTADPIIPYGGGAPYNGNVARVPGWMRPAGGGSLVLPSVRDQVERWARLFGCGRASRRQAATGITLVSRSGCRDGTRVDFYTVTGGGHSWPGSPSLGAGPSTTRIDATQIMLDAFATTSARRTDAAADRPAPRPGE